MTDWSEHNGGPQPVADDVWVITPTSDMRAPVVQPAKSVPWRYTSGCYRILNRHLIDAARLEGIRLGLEAAAVEGTKWFGSLSYGAQEVLASIRALDPETIAREATLDQLTREAQAQGMGYDKENTR